MHGTFKSNHNYIYIYIYIYLFIYKLFAYWLWILKKLKLTFRIIIIKNIISHAKTTFPKGLIPSPK